MDAAQLNARAPPGLHEVLQWLGIRAQSLLPARCLVCTEAGDDGLDLCAACRIALPASGPACLRCALPLPANAAAVAAAPASLPAPCLCGACLRQPPPLHRVRAAFLYAAPLDRLLPRFKFHHDLAAGRLLAQLMAQACAGCERPQALVPVPLHRGRLRRRGYDQALELARPLAAALALPLRTDLLCRVRATTAQSELDAAARRRNLLGAFTANARTPPARAPPMRTVPAHVALVDDVMTTGATLHAAATALHQAGVARVDAWVCARAL